MIFPRILSHRVDPIPLEVSYRDFRKEWVACYIDKTRDQTKLWKMLEPFLRQWQEVLFDSEKQAESIHYQALYWILEASVKRVNSTHNTQEHIEHWAENNNVYTELQLCMYKTIKYYNEYRRRNLGKNLTYRVATDFKFKLRDSILACKFPKEELKPTEVLPETSVEDNIPDYFLLDQKRYSSWEYYMLYNLTGNPETLHLALEARLPRETIYYEEKKLWHKLKQMYS